MAGDTRFVFFNEGFHGDKHLLSIIEDLIKNNQIKYFIETGSNVGSTLAYIAKKYPQITCISCEPDIEAYKHACNNTGGLENVIIYNVLSQDFLVILEKQHSEIAKENILVWLDAHGYGFDWPLKEEMQHFASYDNPFVLIDDFQVPNKEMFGYDVYNEQYCAHWYIKDTIDSVNYRLWYPDYTEKTSQHHPLRGWGLYTFNPSINLIAKEGVIVEAQE